MSARSEISPAGVRRPGSARRSVGASRPAPPSAGADAIRPPRPWHPAFVHFPLACWVLASLLDVAALAGLPPPPDAWNFPEAAAISNVLLWLGLAAAVPTVALGLVDYTRLPAAARDSAEMLHHVAWMAGAASLFLIAAVLRAAGAVPAALFTAIEVLGSVCLVAGGHAAAVVVFERLPRAFADGRSSDRTAPS